MLYCKIEDTRIYGDFASDFIAEYALFLECHKVSESSAHVYVLDLPPTQDPSGKWRFIQIPYSKCHDPGDDCCWVGVHVIENLHLRKLTNVPQKGTIEN